MSLFSLFSGLDTEEQTEKLVEEFSLRISPTDKHELDKLPKHYKKILNAAIRKTIRFVVHVSKFETKEST